MGSVWFPGSLSIDWENTEATEQKLTRDITLIHSSINMSFFYRYQYIKLLINNKFSILSVFYFSVRDGYRKVCRIIIIGFI